jgi:hypothetical protein
VPAERSGMAASAVNTSRELGAVAGVTILGAIVNAQLTSNLLSRLAHIPGLPASVRNEVVVAITTGQTGSAKSLSHNPGLTKIINEVIGAAESSFSQGLDTVLILAGSLMAASAVLSAVLIARGRQAVVDESAVDGTVRR